MQYSSEQVAALELVASILVSQLGLVKDLNLKIDGTASSVYVFLVLPAAFFKCSSLKWYSHITVFLLDDQTWPNFGTFEASYFSMET